MKIPNAPQVARSLRRARQALSVSGQTWLPIDPFKVAASNGWTPIPASVLARQLGYRHSDVTNGAEANACFCSGYYRIIYDDHALGQTRLRWTMAHELGHIMLDHLSQFGETGIDAELSEAQYGVLEREADIFAAELLAPMAVLRALGIRDAADIMLICGLSLEAAGNRVKDLKWRTVGVYREADQILAERFGDFLTPMAVCSSVDEQLFAHLALPWPEAKPVAQKKLLYVETDSNQRFTRCPRCGNTEFSADARYCRVCGLYLFNVCSNSDGWDRVVDNCGHINPGDARYCELCGRRTLLMRAGLLMTWEEATRLKASAGRPPTLVAMNELARAVASSDGNDR